MKRTPIHLRFWVKVNKTDTCWIWKSSKNDAGYGHINYRGACSLAHRVSWELTNGAIPSNMCVLHKCDNPSCVNPYHLFLGTQLDNMSDMKEKNRSSRRPGESNPRAKLMPSNIEWIRKNYPKWSMYKIADRFRVSHNCIWRIIHNQTWKIKKGELTYA